MGSNLGERLDHLRRAVAALEADGVQVLAISPVVQSAAVGGPPDQGEFLNVVVVAHSPPHPYEVLRCCQQIDPRRPGSLSALRGARPIDVDILDFGGQRVAEPDFGSAPPEAASAPVRAGALGCDRTPTTNPAAPNHGGRVARPGRYDRRRANRQPARAGILMTPTRPSLLAAVAAISLVLGLALADLVDTLSGRMIPVPWSSAITVAAVAAALAGWAWSFRRRLAAVGEGQPRVDPFVAVRTAALAMAASPRAMRRGPTRSRGAGLWSQPI